MVVMFRREGGRRAKFPAGGAGVLIVIALVFTYSRGAALAVAALLVALIAVRFLRLRHLAVVGLLIAVIMVAFPSYGNRLASLGGLGGATAQVGSSNAADLSIQSRATENLAAWFAFRDHPLLGVGPGGFPLVYQHYAAMTGGPVHGASKNASEGQPAGEAPQRAAHELLLGIGADQGVAGLIAFVGLIGTAIVGLVRARRRWLGVDRRLVTLATGYLLALMVYLIAGLFLALAFERYLWALVALCAAAAHVLLRDSGAFVPEALGEEIPGRRDEISHVPRRSSDTLIGNERKQK
jgi:putative inorganic carbon (hco3(-)) transporter